MAGFSRTIRRGLAARWVTDDRMTMDIVQCCGGARKVPHKGGVTMELT